MPSNHLEDLVAEWYQLQEYFVLRNVQVGKLPSGGYECELDVVAFHPGLKRLIQIEPSVDATSWEKREQRYNKKFKAGLNHIPQLFKGFEVPPLEQIALFAVGGGTSRTHISGGQVLFIKDFMRQVPEVVRKRRINNAAIPEQYPLLRTLQFAAQYWPLGS